MAAAARTAVEAEELLKDEPGRADRSKPRRFGRLLAGSLLAVGALFGVAVARAHASSPVETRGLHVIGRTAVERADPKKSSDEKAAKKASGKKELVSKKKEDKPKKETEEEKPLECAKAESEDCSKSKCCKDIGFACFEKVEGWALCKEECKAEEMKKYDPNHDEWTCKKLGNRTRCARDGEECASRGCCEEPGTTCFTKGDYWSACMTGCDPAEMKKNDPKGDEWECKPVGERNYVSTCTWAGRDCSKTKCCNNNGFSCAQKDEHFAGCTLTTKKSTWFAEEVPIPEGWEGTVLGYGRTEFAQEPAAEGAEVQGDSLFCLMVYLPNSTEESLMWLAKKNGVSIFGCDKHVTLNSWDSAGAEWDTGETTLINTDVFVNVFEQVRQTGDYLNYDWTVKADPDCVFFADRLKQHLRDLRAPAYMPVYVKNNGVDPGLGNRGFLGAIEIFSKAAMQTYFANAAGCKQFLGVDSGEDGFFKGCMDATGVGFMLDADIFTPDYDPAVCREGGRVAFHPIKFYNEWQCCVDIVMGLKRSPVFGKCEDDGTKLKRDWMNEDA